VRCRSQAQQTLLLIRNRGARGALRGGSLLARSVERDGRRLRLADALLQADVLLAQIAQSGKRLLQRAGVGQRVGELRQLGRRLLALIAKNADLPSQVAQVADALDLELQPQGFVAGRHQRVSLSSSDARTACALSVSSSPMSCCASCCATDGP
jgi:hypothetical protein